MLLLPSGPRRDFHRPEVSLCAPSASAFTTSVVYIAVTFRRQALAGHDGGMLIILREPGFGWLTAVFIVQLGLREWFAREGLAQRA